MPARIIKLAICNGLGISVAVVSVTISALATQKMGWNGLWVTVPYGIQSLSMLAATMPSAFLMQKFGRKPVFLIATLFSVIGGLAGALALSSENVLLLCLAHGLLGINLANVNFYRFAAFDIAKDKHRSSAISMVIFGGTFAAFIGPALSRNADAIFPTTIFSAAYLGIASLGVIIFLILLSISIPKQKREEKKIIMDSYATGLLNTKLLGGMLSAALAYGAMNLLMISASLSMDICGFSYNTISYAIQFHVLAMFVPSLFMGRLIKLFGASKITFAGAMVLAASLVMAILQPTQLIGFQSSLILIGIAWNMTYVGGSCLVAENAPKSLSLQFQAINDFSINLFAMFGSFMPGLMIQIYDWQGTNKIILFISCLWLLILPMLFWSPLKRKNA